MKLSSGDVAWKCEDCEMDTTAIQCAECFEHSDHKGHRVVLKRNVSGCCDCGDEDAWKPQGNCKKHTGVRNLDPQRIINLLPDDMRKSAMDVFSKLIHGLSKDL